MIDTKLSEQDDNSWEVKPGCSFTDGAYQASLAQNNTFIGCMGQSTNYSNFAFQAEMTITEGDGGGLIFRTTSSTTYRFRVDASGHYDLAGLPHDKTIAGTSSAIHTGANQMNLLTVVANGNDLYLYVNKQLVAYISDNSSSSGMIGFMAMDASNATTVQYKNMKVWKLSS